MTIDTTYFRHLGTSIPETEIIYHFISNILGSVVEEKIANTDNDVLTIIEIRFPFHYGRDFFTLFGAGKWCKLRDVVSDIKKRRGKSPMQIVFSFSGVSGVRNATTTILTLQTSGTDRRMIERAIDRVEVLVETIESQISKMPAEVIEIIYCYESTYSRWQPDIAKTKEKVYKFSNDNWKIPGTNFPII